MGYSLDDVGDQTGKIIIITGASSGIGLATTRMLVAKGAQVIMGCRNLEKAQPLAKEINEKDESGSGKAIVIQMDTTDLDSIDKFGDQLIALIPGVNIDALILNAGIMAVDYMEISSRSMANPKMESQMACNVVGHFYLTQVLLKSSTFTHSTRVISVSSLFAQVTKRRESINYDVFLCRIPSMYGKTAAYAESKLANLLLVHELNKRLSGDTVRAFGAHPGYSRTRLFDKTSSLALNLFLFLSKPFSMSQEGGGLIPAVAASLPYANIVPREDSCPYFVPSGIFSVWGAPISNGRMPQQAKDDAQSLKLWETCEELCAIKSVI